MTKTNWYVILLVLVLLGTGTAFYFLGTGKDNPPTQEGKDTPQNQKVTIQENFGDKIVYTSEVDQDENKYQQHCEELGGNFNSCGNPCAPDADMCATVCALTCEDISQDTNQDTKENNNKKLNNRQNEDIYLETSLSGSEIQSPLHISGQAKGSWFFEGGFPVVLTDRDGKIIAETLASTKADRMTGGYVPFTATIEFENPYNTGDSDFMKKGHLILQKANPSGLPQHDDALEIIIQYK